MADKLPVYKMKIHDLVFGLDFVSIVDDPAIGVKGLAFENGKHFFYNDLKQIIAAPVMIPDKLIYRRDDKTGYEYNVFITAEDIENIYEAFISSKKDNKINVDHKTISPSSYIKSSWIIEDKEHDKSRMYGFDLPVGTLFFEVKVKDKEEFLKLKEEGKTSFSIEGVFDMLKVEMNKQKINFMKTKLKDGTEISVSTETLEVGATVNTYDAEGKENPIAEGSYELESGETIIVDATGVITEVKPKAEEQQDADPVKLSEADINSIVEALKPVMAEMIKTAMEGSEPKVDGMKKEEVESEMKKVSEAFETKIKDLEKTIKETPAAHSVMAAPVVEKVKTPLEKKVEAISMLRESSN